MNDCWECEHLEKRVGGFQYCRLFGRRIIDANHDRCKDYKILKITDDKKS